MIKETKLNGFSAIPLEYEVVDGDLSTALGVVSEDGSLKPMLEPKVIMKLNDGETVKFIHQTSSYTHYIIYSSKTGKISSINKDSSSRIDVGTQNDVTHFNAIGNTLLVFTSSSFYYYLWKSNAYVKLGDHIPDIEVSFGLVGHPRLFSLSDESKSTFTISFDGIAEDALNNEFTENNKTRITEQIMAKVNKFVAQETVNKGRFCFPFFIRYALRLYDGSLVYHSAPILMNPSTKAAPVVWWNRAKGKHSYTEAICDIMLMAASIDYCVMRNDDSNNLNDWSDVIKGIDVFISKPIYTYDQEGKIASMSDTDNYNTKFIGRLYADNKDEVSTTKAEDKLLGQFVSKEFLNYYCEWEFSKIYAMYYSADRSYPSTTFHLPEFSEGKVTESIKNTSTFYKLCSIEMADVVADNKRKDIIVDDEYLQSLLTRESMTDDYLTHDQLHAGYSFVYNSRLNLAGLKRKPFNGFLAQSMFAYCNKRFNWQYDETGKTLDISMAPFSTDLYTIKVYIKENGQDYAVTTTEDYYLPEMQLFCSSKMTVESGSSQKEVMSKHSWGCYVFYPNANAYKMVIYNYGSPCYAINLKPHEFLNGAFAVLDYEMVREKNFSSLPSVYPPYNSNAFQIEIPNKIYTSHVNNPFFFPTTGINTIGTGKILGICAAVKALSQGQFGQFPLYAFSTDGVWALEVSSTGSYSAKQPVTREVCVNSESITQMDSAVLFATNRGIMLLSGSQAMCISDSINNSVPLSFIPSLPRIGYAKEVYISELQKMQVKLPDSLDIVPFVEYLSSCRMLFDYTHQRIIVYNPEQAYAYVYSLKTQQWGMMLSNISATVNSYPESLAMNTDANLVNFSATEATKSAIFIITRAFKLDDPNVLKTIDALIIRGTFQRGHVGTVLYGSENLFNWHPIYGSWDHHVRGFGTPYRYFRLVLFGHLENGESISSFSTQYTPRYTNRLR